MKKAFGEGDFFKGMEKNLEISRGIKTSLESKFGAALVIALEAIEANSIQQLISCKPDDSLKIIQARSEMNVARFIKAKLISYVDNMDTLQEQIKELYGSE